MFYTIKHATSHKDNNDIQVTFDKNGNVFIVAAFDGDFNTVERAEYGRYEEAEIAFDAACVKYRMTRIEEPAQDWDATDFD